MLPKGDRKEIYELRGTLGRIVAYVVIAWPRLSSGQRQQVLAAFVQVLEIAISSANVISIETARKTRRKPN